MSMGMYEFWFSDTWAGVKGAKNSLYSNGVVLPVAPDKITLEVNGRSETVELMDGGEVINTKRPGLKTISFEAFLPDTSLPYAYYPDYFHTSQYYIDFFKNLSNEIRENDLRTSFQFEVIRNKNNKMEISTDRKIDENDNKIYIYGAEEYYSMTCILDGYSLVEDAKNGFGVTISLKLKENREAQSDTLVRKQLSNGTYVYLYDRVRSVSKKIDSTYVVKKGDNLWKIAKMQLGNSAWANVIYEMNQEAIEAAARKQGLKSSSKMLFKGTVLTLPEIMG